MDGQYIPDWDKKEHNTITYIGRDKRYKRLDHLVKAFRIVKDGIQDAKLTIAGRGNFLEIKNLADKLNLDVEFYGEISENMKVELHQKTKVFVNPSMKEGWGITIMEANRCGSPAVAYDVSGLMDSINNGETGLLVEDGNIEELANAIIKILREDKFQRPLSKNAFEWSLKFDWDKSSEEFEKMLENMLYG